MPEPGPDCVQIRVKAVGICHTDCHLIKGHHAVLVKRPITLGHEVSGVVAKAGANVAGYRPGGRVAVSLDARGFDFVGAQETTSSALKRVKKGGKVVVVGLAAEEMTISSIGLIERSISLVGSFGAS
ncbi:Sorbitol dehydrogenase [Colletotrichum shisoi]|uniref:Sorbitol dehydrogenase n=1 Tax=Colletotrichum shisoi TaxID=2078593 RepID=A0A5Q4BQ02_9PEZI|nr:Sorbitol dehydrogenase [Colletotrichum shisoi]